MDGHVAVRVCLCALAFVCAVLSVFSERLSIYVVPLIPIQVEYI